MLKDSMSKMYTQKTYEDLQKEMQKQINGIKANYVAQLPQDVRDLLYDIEHGENQKYIVKPKGRCYSGECADEYRKLSGDLLQQEIDAKCLYNESIRINERLNERLNKYQELNENKKALPGFDKISY